MGSEAGGPTNSDAPVAPVIVDAVHANTPLVGTATPNLSKAHRTSTRAPEPVPETSQGEEAPSPAPPLQTAAEAQR